MKSIIILVLAFAVMYCNEDAFSEVDSLIESFELNAEGFESIIFLGKDYKNKKKKKKPKKRNTMT
jgi:hypothetical protein